MKKIALSAALLLISYPGFSCITCNRQVQQNIYNEEFFPNLFLMLSAFIVLALVVALLAYLSAKNHHNQLTSNPEKPDPVPLSTAALILGIGLGGFIDGIVLHQILQWHEMVSNRMPPVTLTAKSVNMFWDGIFHLFTLIVVFVGVFLLWKLLYRQKIDRSGKLLAGGLIFGWGLFNIIEGIIDHHLLKLHNVREITPNPDLWNYGFLAVSGLMLITGYWFMQQRNQHVKAAI